MNEDLIKRLRALAKSEHDDHSIGEEAIEEIERLEKDIAKQWAMAKEAEIIGVKAIRKLRRVRDFLKFNANSEGGVVAEIDDFIGEA